MSSHKDIKLPDRWYALLGSDSRRFLYGLTTDSDVSSYTLFLTDFKDVWVESLSAEEVNAKSRKLGIQLDSMERLVSLILVLKGLLENDSDEDRPLTLESSVDSKALLLKLTKIYHDGSKFEWPLELIKAENDYSLQFISKLNFQLFSNMNYLEYQKSSLMKEIESKDKIILFLKENLRDLGAEKLLIQFENNSKKDNEERKLLSEFDSSKWHSNVSQKYQSSLENNNNYIWDIVKSCIEKSSDWDFGNCFNENEKDKDKKRGKVAKRLLSAGEDFATMNFEELNKSEANIHDLVEKKETPKVKQNSSAKRRKFGVISSKANKDSDDSEAQESGLEDSSDQPSLNSSERSPSESKEKKRVGVISSRKRKLASTCHSSPIKAPKIR